MSTRGPKAGQRLAAMRRILSHAGGAVLTFAQQQQQAAGSSSLSLLVHVLLDTSSDSIQGTSLTIGISKKTGLPDL